MLLSVVALLQADAHAQGSLTLLHAFPNATGLSPRGALILGADGSFYGTTEKGGTHDNGTVFKMTSTGAITILHSFRTTSEGGTQPMAGLTLASDGNFYGVTAFGGTTTPGNGTVFRMTSAGIVTVLHSFAGGAGGATPGGAVIQASDGHLYGVTQSGGTNGQGIAYRLTLTGTFTILHSFAGGSDGASPVAALVQASDGLFFGTTAGGGTSGSGTVFKMSTSGTVTVLHEFNDSDGTSPGGALLQVADDTFYGTTSAGGHPTYGGGGIYRITSAGVFSVLHLFPDNGNPEGAHPISALIAGADGSFYGTTGGSPPANQGTVFKMSPAGAVTVLHSFNGADGSAPGFFGALLSGPDGQLYGTTFAGGSTNKGTAFRISPAGAFATLAELGDGSSATATLVQTVDGQLYGTTANGGAANAGTVFRSTTAGAVTVLHSFANGPGGAHPLGSLLQTSDDTFLGTTLDGGASGVGTVFRITTAGVLTILHSFAFGADNNGAHPASALIRGLDGSFYGTTVDGGAANLGTVFRMTAQGAVTILHAFTGVPDGLHPVGALLQGSNGDFYGTTAEGGAFNFGTVFQMTPSGATTILHAFAGGPSDGAQPAAGLIQESDGALYGTTAQGGPSNAGTVFKVAASGSLTLLHAFNGTDGSTPHGALIQTPDGTFRGTTTLGGASNMGTLFKVTPSGLLTVLHSFAGTADGGSPEAAVVRGADGRYYGTARLAGPTGGGVLFRFGSAPFTDDPLTAGSTVIKAAHIAELRTRINAVRIARGLGAVSWASGSIAAGVSSIRGDHMNELRAALAQVYAAAGLPLPIWTDPGLAGGVTIKATHLAEVRAAVAVLE